MQEFLVLGNIPGTNIQITFTAWLYTVCVLLLLTLVLKRSPHVRQSIYRHVANVRARKIVEFLNQHHLL